MGIYIIIFFIIFVAETNINPVIMRKLNYSLCVMAAAFIFASCGKKAVEASYEVVPLPQEITKLDSHPFLLEDKTTLLYPEGEELLKQNAEFLALYINQATGQKLAIQSYVPGSTVAGQSIVLGYNNAIVEEEGYTLNVNSGKDRKSVV